MITDKTTKDHTRIGASCFECARLHDLDEKEGCKLKDNILDPNVEWCNYAAEGCFRYLGGIKRTDRRGGKRDYLANRDINKRVRELLFQGINLSECESLGIEKSRVHNNIVVLTKQGYKLEKTLVNKLIIYKIIENETN